MTFEELLEKMEHQDATLVWWSQDQIAREEHLINDPTKGNRPWSVPRATGEFLHRLIMERKPLIILELGTSIGYSTVWMAHACSSYGGHIHTIEMKQEKYDLAKQNLSDGELLKYVTLYHGQIYQTLLHLSAFLSTTPIDFLFMDADRGHYHEYFPLIKDHLAPNALIVADNAKDMGARMQLFFDLLKQEGWKYEIKDLDNGILIAQR